MSEKASKRKGFRFDANTRHLVGRLLREYLADQTRRIAIAVFGMVIVASCAAVQASMIEPALNKVLNEGDRTLVYLIPLAFLGISIVKGFASYLQAVMMQNVGLRVIATMQSQMFARMVEADLAYIQGDSTGRLISRFTNDVNFLRDAIVKTFTGIARDFLVVIFLVGVMFYMNWKMSLVALVVFPIAVLPIVRIGRRLRRVSRDTQAHVGGVTGFLDDVFKGMRQVKAYGMEEYEKARADDMFEGVFRYFFKAGKTRSRSYPIMETLTGTAVAAVLLWGGLLVLAGQTNIGTFMAFFAAMLMAYAPLRSLANLNSSLQEGLAAAERTFEMIDYRPSIVDRPDAAPLVVREGRVDVRDVTFAYPTGKVALDDVSMAVPAGKTVALVGPSGAGKSTMLNLIPRFYEVQQGAIEIDGQDVANVTLKSLRGAVALVSQEVSLFNDTVRANIAYGRWGASDEEIVAAAKAAAAHDFISELPEGYDTIVGEHGTRLSGGQRQRLSIARAMLKNAPILLLDEATSALDSESERQVQEALNRLTKDRTTLVIAHRFATVLNADIIYVFDRGRIVERGTHPELLARGGLYARLCRMQFEDSELLHEPAAAGLKRQA
ncbi:MAG: ABC transporter ATP-binding protein [Alphaproteobacteria bacterium]